MSEVETCPGQWNESTRRKPRCELTDNLAAHENGQYGLTSHRKGNMSWGVKPAERARWAAIEAAGMDPVSEALRELLALAVAYGMGAGETIAEGFEVDVEATAEDWLRMHAREIADIEGRIEAEALARRNAARAAHGRVSLESLRPGVHVPTDHGEVLWLGVVRLGGPGQTGEGDET